MFNQPSPSLNISTVIHVMLAEERELLTVLGQDFLAEHLEHVENRLKRWQRFLANHYEDVDRPPRGDADRLRAYQIEHALIAGLAAQSQTEPFPVVHQRVLRQARQRVRVPVSRQDFTNPSLRTARFKAHLEHELLVEMWAKWRAWLNPRKL